MGRDSETNTDLRVIADGWREKYEFVKAANMDLNAAIEEKNKEIRKLRKLLQFSEWRPITAEDLPKYGEHEVGGWRPDGRFNTGSVGVEGTVDAWFDHGWTHFRLVDPPKPSETPAP